MKYTRDYLSRAAHAIRMSFMAQYGGGGKPDKVLQADRLALRNSVKQGDMKEYARKAFKLQVRPSTGDSNYTFASSTVCLSHACLSAVILLDVVLL